MVSMKWQWGLCPGGSGSWIAKSQHIPFETNCSTSFFRLEKKSYIEYLLDILLYDTPEEKKALVAEQRKEVMKLEQRIAGHTAEHDRGRSQRKSGLDR